MTATSIPGPGLTGVLRLTWVHDHLAHVLDHSQHRRALRHLDQPSGIASDGRVCPGRLMSGVPQWLHAAGEQCP